MWSEVDLCTDSFVLSPGMIALNKDGHVAAGTSTNGLTHKVPGYVHYVDVSVKKILINNSE